MPLRKGPPPVVGGGIRQDSSLHKGSPKIVRDKSTHSLPVDGIAGPASPNTGGYTMASGVEASAGSPIHQRVPFASGDHTPIGTDDEDDEDEDDVLSDDQARSNLHAVTEAELADPRLTTPKGFKECCDPVRGSLLTRTC